MKMISVGYSNGAEFTAIGLRYFYLRHGCFSCRLSVCLLSASRKKTTDGIFMRSSPEMYQWTRKKL